jgi:hypothetical protein
MGNRWWWVVMVIDALSQSLARGTVLSTATKIHGLLFTCAKDRFSLLFCFVLLAFSPPCFLTYLLHIYLLFFYSTIPDVCA